MARDLSYPGAGYAPNEYRDFINAVAALGYPGPDYFFGANSGPVPLFLTPAVSIPTTLITLRGVGFTAGYTPPWTGGTPPTFTFVNDTTITFVAPAVGNYTVGGLSFTSVVAPVYTVFQPSAAVQPNSIVSLRGSNFNAAIPPVWTGGNEPAVTFLNATTYRFTSPALAGSYTLGGVALTVSATAPVFSSVSPAASVTPGSTVTITGTNLSAANPPTWTGANQPTFNYINATTITFVAPVVGNYSVGGLPIAVSATASVFTSVNPIAADPGSTVTITGTNLSAANPPTWIGGNQPTFTFVNGTTITFIAPVVGNYTVGGLSFRTAIRLSVVNQTTPLIGTPQPDTFVYELGVRFTPTVNGTVYGVKFWNADNISGRTCNLWLADGTLLGSANAVGNILGWNYVNLATPIAVTAGVSYVTSARFQVNRLDVPSTDPQVTSADPRIGFAVNSAVGTTPGSFPGILGGLVYQGADVIISFP